MHTVESILARCIEDGDCLIWQGARSHRTAHPAPVLADHDRPSRVCHARPILFSLLGKHRPRNKTQTMMTCWNSLCLAPDHMVAASRSDVIAGATKAGRYSATSMQRSVKSRERGRSAPHAKLDMDKAREIRKRYFGGEATMLALAADYGVHCSLICKVIHNKAWTELAANASVFNLAHRA